MGKRLLVLPFLFIPQIKDEINGVGFKSWKWTDTIIKKLMQIKEGVTVTVVCFQPDTENRDVDYDVTAPAR